MKFLFHFIFNELALMITNTKLKYFKRTAFKIQLFWEERIDSKISLLKCFNRFLFYWRWLLCKQVDQILLKETQFWSNILFCKHSFAKNFLFFFAIRFNKINENFNEGKLLIESYYNFGKLLFEQKQIYFFNLVQSVIKIPVFRLCLV